MEEQFRSKQVVQRKKESRGTSCPQNLWLKIKERTDMTATTTISDRFDRTLLLGLDGQDQVHGMDTFNRSRVEKQRLITVTPAVKLSCQ